MPGPDTLFGIDTSAQGYQRPEQGPPVIVFEDIWKRFGSTIIYEGLNLTVHKGETITILGGSGSGKSVLLKCLLRLLTPERGHIYAFGEEITGRNETQMLPIRARIGMLFQGAALFDSMDVAANIAYPLRQHGWTDEKRIRDRVAETLDLVNLPGIEAKWPAELSGGMKKRIGLARAIAIEPEVILYDEPTTGLDPSNVKNIDGLIMSMQEKLGVTSIVVTHDMASAFRVSDRIAMLWDKRLVWTGWKDEVLTSGHPVVQAFIKGELEG